MHPLTLRPLTLGVLIVAGGTLAALPFRRHRPAGEHASSAVSSSDGPIGSNLTSIPLGTDLPARPLEPEPLRDARRGGGQLASSIRPQRSMHAPLTYEDLAVPIGSSRLAQQSRPDAAPAGAAERDATRAAGAPPRDFRPKAALPPETDLQPLALSESPAAAGLAETGADGSRSVLVPTPETSSAAEPPTPNRPQRREASARPEARAAEKSSGATRTETGRLAEDAQPRDRSLGFAGRTSRAAEDRAARGQNSPPSREGSPDASTGTLASSKRNRSSQKLSVADHASAGEPRRRYWIRQPQ